MSQALSTTSSRLERLASGFLLLAGLAACGGGGDSGGGTPVAPPPANGDQPYVDGVEYSNAPGASLSSAEEHAAVTHHQITVGGQALPYVATAGHLTAADPGSGAPEATIFYVAYTSGDPGTRPVTFVLSGGPGDSQGDLHLGSYAPRRVVTNEPSLSEPASPSLVDNQETLLDKTDLVFLDEPGTGWSEAIAPNTNDSLRGVDPDIAVYRDFITRWLSVNQRTASPTFLLGHSYGTARSAMLSNMLPPAGVNLRGVVLESPILNFGTNCDTYAAVQFTGSCAGSLPTFEAIAANYGRVQPAPTDLAAFLQAARTFDDSSYAPAVAAWLSSQTAPAPALTTQLAALTGIPAGTWTSHMDMTNADFRALLTPGSLLGRTDARVVVPATSPLAQGDPAGNIVDAAFGGAFPAYVQNELGYTNTSPYDSIDIDFTDWPATHDGQPVPDFIPDLSAAIARDPGLPVLALMGNYDLATPFHQTELDLARLGDNPNVQQKHYAAGHNLFLDNQARPQAKTDIAAFYDRAASAP